MGVGWQEDQQHSAADSFLRVPIPAVCEALIGFGELADVVDFVDLVRGEGGFPGVHGFEGVAVDGEVWIDASLVVGFLGGSLDEGLGLRIETQPEVVEDFDDFFAGGAAEVFVDDEVDRVCLFTGFEGPVCIGAPDEGEAFFEGEVVFAVGEAFVE